MYRELQKKNKGFTLIELLVVISIISILSSVILVSIKVIKQSANDSQRVQSIKAFEQGLELYYAEYGKYPGWNNGGPLPSDRFPGGNSTTCYSSYWLDSSGECGAGPIYTGVNYDNSASSGFLNILNTEGLISELAWNDPRKPTTDPEDKLKWNCRYIVKKSERDAGNVQNYVLHCRVEKQSLLSQNDDGFNPMLFEVQKPEPWLCILDNPSEITGDTCN